MIDRSEDPIMLVLIDYDILAFYQGQDHSGRPNFSVWYTL